MNSVAKTKEKLLSELKEMFEIAKPDSDYLLGDEDTQQDVTAIEAATKSNSGVPVTDQIAMLYHFNSDWFPDEVEDDEQEEYRLLLDEAATHF